MEEIVQERRFNVRWYLHLSHPQGGMFRGRTFYVSSTGLLFFAPVRYRVGDTFDMEIFIESVRSIRCTVKIVADGSPYSAEFLRFSGDDHKLLNDTLLALHRKNVTKRK